MGVMPVPPATMPMAALELGSYTNLTKGPFISRLSPTRSAPMALDTVPAAYDLTTSSKLPRASAGDVGV